MPTEPNQPPTATTKGEPQALVSLSAAEVLPLREAMGDLQRSVAGYYAETARGGDLGPSVRTFLVAAQTLNELLTKGITQPESYKNLFLTGRHSAADLIDAVKFARNIAQHVLHIVKPSNDVTLIGGTLGLRVYAVWDDVPAHVVAKLRPGTQRLEAPYRSTLEGQEVTRTMMAVLRFYADVSPKLVHRDSRGEWTGFPLLSQPGMDNPLHPEEPLDSAESRKWINQRTPGGDCRVVCGQVTIDGRPYVYGHTFVGRYSFSPFVETVVQANYDISIGYTYLQGNIAANIEDATDRFPLAHQGPVIASRSEVFSWASTISRIELCVDWHGPGVDAVSWTRVVETETDTRLPESFRFGPRRARRLNALVPPR
ncbi:hypothetical protein ACHABX_08875 [Nesterenkonia halotolerans]|uniref:hypothetical protein n=1 Tax=Nesterenkonia halotolerans TaxID=225325 RepID=UPI003EE55AA4